MRSERKVCPKCGSVIKKARSENGSYIYACMECIKKASAGTPDEAWSLFCKELGVPDPETEIEKAVIPPAPATPTLVATSPAPEKTPVAIKDKESFQSYITCNMESYTSRISFLQKSSVERLLENNLKYLVTEKAFDSLWQTEEGRQSLMDCFNEAFQMAAELPLLGSVVAFGSTATFIPRVEAFQNVLCNGPNAPFEWVNIDAIHAKDKVRIGRKNGNFTVEFESISPFDRGDIKGVVVYGYHKRSHIIIGECYEAERLHAIGTATSSSYRQYLLDCDFYNRELSEGKVKEDSNGRKYVEKSIPKKNGGTWMKKVYGDELSNPYEGPHREKMLKKVAGKTYLSPFIKMRIGSVIIDEIQNLATPEGMEPEPETVQEQSVNMAEEQFSLPEPDATDIPDDADMFGDGPESFEEADL